MAKYHVNPKTGEVGKCNSKQDKCPFGGEGIHRDSIVDAQQLADEINIAHAYTITGNFKTAKKFNSMLSTLTCGNCDEEDQVKLMARGILELGGGESDVNIVGIEKYPPDYERIVTYKAYYLDEYRDEESLEIYKERYSGRWISEDPNYELFYDNVSEEKGFDSDIFKDPYANANAPTSHTTVISVRKPLTLDDIDTITFENGDDFNNKFNELKFEVGMTERDEAKLIARGIKSLGFGDDIKVTKVERFPGGLYNKAIYGVHYKNEDGDDMRCEMYKSSDDKWYNESPDYEIFYNKISQSKGFDETLFYEPNNY